MKINWPVSIPEMITNRQSKETESDSCKQDVNYIIWKYLGNIRINGKPYDYSSWLYLQDSMDELHVKTFDPVRSKTFSLKDQTFCVNGDNEMTRDLHKWG